MVRPMYEPPAPETWLFLGPPPLAESLAQLAPDVTLHTAPTARLFLRQLQTLHPRLAVAVSPPAGRAPIAGLAALVAGRDDLTAVLLDAPGAVDERLAALRAGLHEALPSTASPREIVVRLRLLAARRSGGPGPQPVPVAEGVVLGLAAHALVRDGREVHLRPKELALLATMAAQPSRVFTRRELDERVWGSYRPDSRRVDVHVRWLRVKLEPE